MSVDALLARLAVPSAVPPVPSRFPGEGTGEPFVNQGGSPSSLGSPEKADSQGDISGTAPDWHGFSLSYLEAAAGPDWPAIQNRPVALAFWASLLRPSEPDPSAPRFLSWLVTYADGSTERLAFDTPACQADAVFWRPVSESIAPEGAA